MSRNLGFIIGSTFKKWRHYITLTAIDAMAAGVAKAIAGTTDAIGVKIYYKLHADSVWTLAGTATVDRVAQTWTYSLTIAVAGTYDIQAVDSNNASRYAQQDSLVVASGVINIEDFESYTLNDNISNVASWSTSSLKMDVYCTSDGSTGKCGALVTSVYGEYAGYRTKSFSSVDITDKKLKFKVKYVKGQYDNPQLKVTIGAWNSGWITLSGYAQNAWQDLEFTHGLTSATSIKFETQGMLFYLSGNYTHINDVKFE